jgi:putative transposase
LKRADAKRQDSHKPEPTQPAVPIVASGREIQLSLDRDELYGLMQDSLENLALKLGMVVASSLPEHEVTRVCGRRHERRPHRTHTRYGHQRGTATMAGQKIAIARPRVRRTDGGGEVSLETYARLQSPEAMPEAVLRRMVRGVSTRDYANVIDLIPDGYGVQKSSVSRGFVQASPAQVKALAERRFHGTHFPVILIDGVEYAGETMIVAVGITADGTKRVLGLRQGATENAAVCVALLEDLQARGLDTSQPVLPVLDGAKALHAAAKRAWGQNGVIQRCQVHKKRNVKAHVPEKHHAELQRRLSEAYHETGYEAAKASLEATARWLERNHNPDGASSLREGLHETLTVVRLGLAGALRRTFATTNPIEARSASSSTSVALPFFVGVTRASVASISGSPSAARLARVERLAGTAARLFSTSPPWASTSTAASASRAARFGPVKSPRACRWSARLFGFVEGPGLESGDEGALVDQAVLQRE